MNCLSPLLCLLFLSSIGSVCNICFPNTDSKWLSAPGLSCAWEVGCGIQLSDWWMKLIPAGSCQIAYRHGVSKRLRGGRERRGTGRLMQFVLILSFCSADIEGPRITISFRKVQVKTRSMTLRSIPGTWQREYMVFVCSVVSGFHKIDEFCDAWYLRRRTDRGFPQISIGRPQPLT